MSDPYESWQEEKQSAWLYRVVAECERGTTRDLFERGIDPGLAEQVGGGCEHCVAVAPGVRAHRTRTRGRAGTLRCCRSARLRRHSTHLQESACQAEGASV